MALLTTIFMSTRCKIKQSWVMAKGERSEPKIFEFFVGNVRFCLIFRYNMSLCWLILYQQNSKFTGKILNVPTNCKIRGFQPLIHGEGGKIFPPPHFYLRWEGCPWLSILKGDLKPIYDSARPNFLFSFFFLPFFSFFFSFCFRSYATCPTQYTILWDVNILLINRIFCQYNWCTCAWALVMIVHNPYLYWSETYGNLYNIMIDERSR